jgi:hypothetical protein
MTCWLIITITLEDKLCFTRNAPVAEVGTLQQTLGRDKRARKIFQSDMRVGGYRRIVEYSPTQPLIFIGARKAREASRAAMFNMTSLWLTLDT